MSFLKQSEVSKKGGAMKINLPVTDNEYVLSEECVLVSKTDLKGIITYCNNAFCEVSGFLENELIGHAHNIIRHPDVPPRVFQHAWDTIEAGESWHGIVKNRRKNGDYYWVDANITPIFEQGKTVGYLSLRYKPTPAQKASAIKLYRSVSDGKMLPKSFSKPDEYYVGMLQQRLAEKIVAQEAYLERKEQEQRIAAGYMNRLIALDKIKDTSVQFHLQPAENFSGDLLAIARTPDARLHLLLADSTGHGLAASLAAMPIIHPFYSMSSKGFNISTIAQEINAKVKQSLPVSHFVAATIVAIDPHAGMVEVWCGGCPPPLVLDSDGNTIHEFKSRHLAMGILTRQEFDASIEYYSYDQPGQSVLMFSDGVIELENEQGEQFGLARLLKALQTPAANLRMEILRQALNKFSGNRVAATDDIALMLAQCEITSNLPVRKREGKVLALGLEHIVWHFSLALDIQQIKKLDVVPLLLDIVQQVGKEKAQSGKIFMILSELYNNALDHGILKLDSTLKQQGDGMEKYFEERAKRLADAEEGNIQMHLKKILNEDGSSFLRIRMKDSGEGFSHHRWNLSSVMDTQPHGRGITLLHGICRTVHFIGNGSEVVVRFDLGEEAKQ